MSASDRLRLPLLLDGATGTCFLEEGMPLDVCTEQWAMEHPEIVRKVARGYADAGSDVVSAPTFLANSAMLSTHGLESRMEEINIGLVKIVKEALEGRNILVAGNLSTTGLLREPFGDTDFDELVKIFAAQAAALAAGGADLLAVETMSTLSECRAAVLGARPAGLPVLVSMTVDAQGRTHFGDDVLACMTTLQELGIFAFGLNCSHGPRNMEPIFEQLAPYAKVPLLAKPSAGSPPLTPVQFSDHCAALMRRGVSVVGGCCQTGPAHIAALRHMVDSFDLERVYIRPAPHELLATGRGVYYMSDDLEYSKPITCEREMGDDLIAAVEEGCGALLIRLEHPDDGYYFSLNAHMADVPAAFESESLEALESALYYYQGRAILVSTSCEIEKEDLERLAAKYGAIVL